MEFNEAKAKEIIQQHKLSANTLKTWRNRGTIPEKYLNPVYTKPKPASAAVKAIEARIIAVLVYDFMNATHVLQLANVPRARFTDVQRKKTQFTTEQVNAIRKELKIISLQAAKAFETPGKHAVKELLKHPAVKLIPLFRLAGLDRNFYEKAKRFSEGRNELTISEIQKLKDMYMIFKLKISV